MNVSEYPETEPQAPDKGSPAAALSMLPMVMRHRRSRYVANVVAGVVIVGLLVSAAFNPRFEWGVVAQYR
jgi:hypothetical protein